MKEIFEDAAWKKTLQLIEEKYGKTLQYRSLKLINDQKKSAYQNGDDFVIPLSLKNHDLGNVIVNRGSFLDEQQKSEIIDLIKFLLEPQVYNLHLKNSEMNLESQKATAISRNLVPKVVPLHQNILTAETGKKLLSQIIHLKSLTTKSRLKVALKIHEMSERNLFVRIEDVLQAHSSVEDLLVLNDTTIFIEDIEQLNASMLKIVEDFLTETAKTRADAGPIVLIGSSLAMETVESQNWSLRLKSDLMGFYFDIDRVPVSQQTSEDILELLFFEVNEPMS